MAEEWLTPINAIYAAGRWVAICPTDNNAMQLTVDQPRFECGSITGIGADGTTADLTWPADPAAIEASLAGAPIDEQNWSPT